MSFTVFFAQLKNAILTGLGLLTIIPVPRLKKKDIEYFNTGLLLPLVGFFIGLLGSFFLKLVFSQTADKTFAGISLFIFFFILTGGLHLDGLIDFFDVLGARAVGYRGEIEKDYRVGTFGVIAAILYIFTWIELFANLPEYGIFGIRAIYMIVPCAIMVSRWSIVMVASFGKYPKGRNSKMAQPLVEELFPEVFWKGGLFVFIIMLFVFGYKGIVILIINYFCMMFLLVIGEVVFKGTTGDLLGCTACMSELLFFMSVRWLI